MCFVKRGLYKHGNIFSSAHVYSIARSVAHGDAYAQTVMYPWLGVVCLNNDLDHKERVDADQ